MITGDLKQGAAVMRLELQGSTIRYSVFPACSQYHTLHSRASAISPSPALLLPVEIPLAIQPLFPAAAQKPGEAFLPSTAEPLCTSLTLLKLYYIHLVTQDLSFSNHDRLKHSNKWPQHTRSMQSRCLYQFWSGLRARSQRRLPST